MNQADRLGLRRVEQLGREHQLAGGRADRMADDLHRDRRERNADVQLRQPDLPARHDPDVARGGDDAAAGDRVPVDGGDNRTWMVKDRQEGLGQRRNEFASVRPSARHDLAQVDARGEDGSRPGDHHGPVRDEITHDLGDLSQ
jgi:hypothetical protein